MGEEKRTRPPAARRWVTWLRWLGTLASLALLATLLGRQDWRAIVRSVGSLPAGSLIAAAFLILAGQAFNTLRWWVLLRAQSIRVSYGRALRLVFAGLFASNFLPSTIGGDVVRLAGILDVAADRVAGAASIVVDRAVSVFGMLFLLPFSGITFSQGLASAGPPWALAAVGVGARVSSFLGRAAQRLLEALAIWRRRPGSLARALLASWVGVVCYIAALWVLAHGLKMSVSWVQVAGVTGITYWLTVIPISINGYGLREAAMVALYVQIGAVAEDASALALISRLLLMAASVPGAAALPGLIPNRQDK